MKLRLLILGCFIQSMFSFSQGVENVGARSISLGEATVALQDIYSYFSNPASNATISSIELGMNYQNKFLINEFQQSSAVVAKPLKNGVMTIGGMISGQNLFRSTRIGTGYAIRLSENFSIGAQINFQQIQVQNITQSNDLQASIGLLFQPFSRLKLGVAIFNLGAGIFDQYKTEISPLLLRIGGNYSVNSKLNVLAEIEKDVLHPYRLKSGVEYIPIVNFSLRSGIIFNEQTITFGFGYRSYKRLFFDLGGAWQQRLGWSPTVGIRYAFDDEN